MYEEFRIKILAKCYDFLIASAMIAGSSLLITLAITLPFMAFGQLHAGFCGK